MPQPAARAGPAPQESLDLRHGRADGATPRPRAGRRHAAEARPPRPRPGGAVQPSAGGCRGAAAAAAAPRGGGTLLRGRCSRRRPAARHCTWRRVAPHVPAPAGAESDPITHVPPWRARALFGPRPPARTCAGAANACACPQTSERGWECYILPAIQGWGREIGGESVTAFQPGLMQVLPGHPLAHP